MSYAANMGCFSLGNNPWDLPLDYLADAAEAGQRQLFFATADDKLAKLFQEEGSTRFRGQLS